MTPLSFDENRVSRAILWFIAIFSLVLGSLVLTGYVTGNESLLRIRPSFPIMRLSTAICFFLTGSALIFIQIKQHILSKIIALIIFFIGLYSLFLNLNNYDFSMNQFLFIDYFNKKNDFRENMATNAAISFMLISLNLILISQKMRTFSLVLVQLLCSIVMAITSATLFGYLTGLHSLIGWADSIGMAFHTAFGLFLVSSGIFVHQFSLEFSFERISIGPIIGVSLFAGLFTFLLWFSFNIQQYEVLLRQTRFSADIIANDLTAYFQETHRALVRQANRWEHINRFDANFWEKDFQVYLKDFPWIASLRIFNNELNEVEKGTTYVNLTDLIREELLENKKFAFTENNNLFLIYPIESKSKDWLVAEIDIPLLLDNTLQPSIKKYYTSFIYFDNELIYKDPKGSSDFIQPVIETIDSSIGKWEIKVYPTKETLALNQTGLQTFVLISGIIATIFITLAVLLAQLMLLARNRLATALKEKEEANVYKQAILDSSAYSIISTDLAGTINIFNHAAEHMLGYKAEEMINKKTPEVFHDKQEVEKRAEELSIKPGFEVFVDAAKKGMHEEREWTYLHKNGSRLPVMLSITPVKNSEKNTIGFLGIAYDLTQIKLAENLKKEMIAITSHELRSPIAAISSSLELLNISDPQEKQILEIAKKNCDRLLRLTADILDMQKMETGLMTFNFSTFPLSTLISQSLEANKSVAKANDVEIKVSQTIPNVIIHGDMDRLMQVLTNLIANAIKYSPKNGIVNFVFVENGHQIRIGIQDQGAGIPSEYIPLLFQKFSQLPGGKKGTGLGLSIAKAIVTKHHGTIGVESSHQGSTFWFEIPVKKL